MIFSAKTSEVRGPEAIIAGASGISVISSLIRLIFGFSSIIFVTFEEKSSLSIARAAPAGTAESKAAFIKKEPRIDISFFKSPLAFVTSKEPRLFEQTNSARFSVLCAPVVFFGRISYKSTSIPLFASCNAASEPANPPPITTAFIIAPFHQMCSNHCSGTCSRICTKAPEESGVSRIPA